jgi:hypothetical protein
VRQTTTTVGGIPVTRTLSNTYGMAVSSTGAVLAAPFRLDTQADYAVEPSAVYVQSTGDIVALWKEVPTNLSSSKLYAARYTLVGTLVDGPVRCAPADSPVGAYSAAAVSDSLVALAWHSTSSMVVSSQYLSAAGLALSQAEAVSTGAAEPDVPVSVSVSAADSAVLIGWLSASHLGRDSRQVLADYLVLRDGVSSVAGPRAPGVASARVLRAGPATVVRYSLLGRSLGVPVSSEAPQQGVYLLRDAYGRWVRRVSVR